jgi:predicted RNase H-like HicB family nuclease
MLGCWRATHRERRNIGHASRGVGVILVTASIAWEFPSMTISSFTAVVTREGDQFVALCVELDMASQGSTVEEALDNVRQAVELFHSTADDDELARRRREVVVKTFDVQAR